MNMQHFQAENMSEEFTDSTPEWATAQGCRDNRGRRPNHPEYD